MDEVSVRQLVLAALTNKWKTASQVHTELFKAGHQLRMATVCTTLINLILNNTIEGKEEGGITHYKTKWR